MNAIEVVKVLVNAGVGVRSYSGRGMYGSSCVSMRCDPLEAVAEIINSNAVDDLHELGEVVSELIGYRSDSMGLGMVYYWPSLEWTDEVAELVGGNEFYYGDDE